MTTRAIIISVAALASFGCGASDPGEAQFEGDVRETAEPFLGVAIADSSCLTQGRGEELEKLAKYGRILARSNAVAECMRQVFAGVVPLTLHGGDHGPYVACGSGSVPTDQAHVCSTECPLPPAGSDCKCDPVVTGTAAQQRARLLSAAVSRLPIEQFCVDEEEMGEGLGFATAMGINGGNEQWEWGSLGDGATFDAIYAAALAHHEALHDLGYSHGANSAAQQPDNCGFGLDNRSAYSAYKSGLALSACLAEVGYRTEDASYANCDLESTECEANELRVMQSFDSGSGECECVPDTFELSFNANANEADDGFGSAIAAGDFDNDGDDDLAVGVPGEDSGAGAVYLYRGSVTGLLPWKRITQSDLTVDDAALGSSTNLGHEAGDRFGAALAAGDFNNDGYDDLAIGLPRETLGSASESGYAVVLPGTSNGLKFRRTSTSPNPTGLTQASLGANESGDHLGWSLAAGDLSGDGLADLAIGVPHEALGTATSGVVMLFKGQTGQSRIVAPWTYLHQQTSGSFSTNESGDEFGAAVAIGNLFGSDSRKELAIGSPGERWNNANDEGYVWVADFNGVSSWTMLATANPNYSGVSRFGSALATGDVVGDSVDDLVIGAPEESSGVGGVLIFKGMQGTLSYAQYLHNGDSVAGDRFGAALTVGDFRVGSKKDLAVGIPGEVLDTSTAEGAIWVYTGSTTTMSSFGYRGQGEFYSVDATDSVLPTEQRDPGFGFALTSGNFNGSGGAEVVVGAPFDEPGQDGVDSGAVFLFRSQSIADAQKIDQVTTRFGDDHFD